MNEHEIARIAAAMHQARPDWPTKQLVTLLNDPRMVDRPRRDAFVALSWVACEPNTASPYRVLEGGPWWKAATFDTPTARRHATRDESCARCAQVLTDSCCDQPAPRRLTPARRPDDFQETQR